MVPLLSLLFLALFFAPVGAFMAGRLRKRWAVLVLVLLIVGTLAGLMAAYTVFLNGRASIGTTIGDAEVSWFLGLACLSFAVPGAWYLRRHSEGLKRTLLLFGSVFDPRLTPRGPAGKLGSNKYLSGTKPPTGSRRLAAWRNKLFDMGPQPPLRKDPPKKKR
jgi:hypothetical protein